MKKILAIDDNEINLRLINEIITHYYPDYSFLSAANGLKGIEIAKEQKPEIILLDIIMPGLNGYEVCGILKRDNLTQNIPVLMISALGGNSEDRTKGLNAGADAFISKPFTVSELQAQINVALRIRNVEDLLRKRNETLELSIKTETNKYLIEEERILQISEHARQFYWEVDNNGDFIYVSPVIESILKIKSLDIIGKIKFSELFDTIAKNSHLDFSEIISRQKEAEVELKVGKAKLWLIFKSFPFNMQNGHFTSARGICYDITQRKNAENTLLRNMKQIQQYQKKLKKLNVAISHVEELERRRIAENLHDSLGQTLSLAYIKLSAIDMHEFQANTRKAVNEIFSLLNKAINESKQITYDLSPPILYELGLIPAFKWRLEQIERTNNIRTKITGEKVDFNFKKDDNIFIYRIVNELLQNAVKHAKASEIDVEIMQKGNKYLISVRDNGIGFKVLKKVGTEKIGGFGLQSIKERLESLRGKLYLKSDPGNFTTATIEIPDKNI